MNEQQRRAHKYRGWLDEVEGRIGRWMERSREEIEATGTAIDLKPETVATTLIGKLIDARKKMEAWTIDEAPTEPRGISEDEILELLARCDGHGEVEQDEGAMPT